jgi:hypothetical protein
VKEIYGIPLFLWLVFGFLTLMGIIALIGSGLETLQELFKSRRPAAPAPPAPVVQMPAPPPQPIIVMPSPQPVPEWEPPTRVRVVYPALPEGRNGQ